MKISKSCSKCLVEKPISEFNKQSSTKDGYAFICKTCKSFMNKKRYNSLDKEQYINNVKEWQQENYDKVLNYIKKYKSKK